MFELNDESYKDVPGHLWDQDAKVLQAICRGRNVLEIGTHRGRSTVAIAAVATAVHTIDWGLGDSMQAQFDLTETWDNIKKAGASDKVQFYRGDWTTLITTLCPLHRYEVVFYDAAHEPPDAYEEDFLNECLRQGYRGVIVVHDYKPKDPSMKHVVRAVDKFSETTGRELQLRPQSSVAWFWGILKGEHE